MAAMEAVEVVEKMKMAFGGPRVGGFIKARDG